MSSEKLCVICGGEDEIYKEGGWGPDFSKELKLGKFCGELELSLGLSGVEGGFRASSFLQELDKCSNWVKVCRECSILIGETVDKRVELEEMECEVLELQIKLLVKLKELEGCSKLYFGEMRRVMERVKGSQLNGLERSDFGVGKGKCDVLGFREGIINVVTSQQIFQDNLNTKLGRGDKGHKSIPAKFAEEVESPSSPDWIPSMDDVEDSSNEFDNLCLSSPPPDSPNLNNSTEKQTLEEIKMEIDNQLEEGKQNKEEESRLTLTDEDKSDKPEKDKRISKPYVDRHKQARMNKRKLSHVNWSGMGPLKTRLIKNILTGPGLSSKNPFNKYKWSYLAPTDQVHFADDYPIQIMETEKDDGLQSLTLECTSCGFKTNLEISTNQNEKISEGIQKLKKDILNHVLHLHLNAFNCSQCPEEKRASLKITTWDSFRVHLKTHTGWKRNRGRSAGDDRPHCCEICGKSFKQNYRLKIHLDLHQIQNAKTKEEKDKLKRCQCSTCGKRFYDNQTLKEHEVCHKPMEMRERVTCSFRGKEVFKRAYPNHKRISCPVQAKNEVMTCWICGKSYKGGKSLGDHLVRTHRLPERPKL